MMFVTYEQGVLVFDVKEILISPWPLLTNYPTTEYGTVSLYSNSYTKMKKALPTFLPGINISSCSPNTIRVG